MDACLEKVLDVMEINGIDIGVTAGECLCKETGFRFAKCYFIHVLGKYTIAQIERLVYRIRGVYGVYLSKNCLGEYDVKIRIAR